MKAQSLMMLAALSGFAHAGKQTVVIASDDAYPPYSSVDANKAAKGHYVDIIRAVSDAMPNFSISIKPLPWKRALQEAEDGEVAGVFPPYMKTDSRPWMAYSAPLLTEAIVAVCNSKKAPKYRGAKWPEGFEGASFGNNLGYLSAGPAFFAMVKAGKLKNEEAATTEQNLRKLVADRIDCYVNDRRAIAYDVIKSNLDGKQIVEVAVVAKEVGYIGYNARIGKLPYQDAFIKEFNATLQKLRAEKKVPPLD